MSVPQTGPKATVNWDPKPIKAAMKGSYKVISTVATGALEGVATVAAAKVCPKIPEGVKKAVVGCGLSAAGSIAQKAYDRGVDDAYATPESVGNRIVGYYRGK